MSKEIKALKEKEVQAIEEKVKKAKGIVLVDYRGLTVKQDTELRSEFRKNNVEYKVLKNKLVLRALNNSNFKGFDKVLEGPTAVAFGYDDAIVAAKIAVESSAKFTKMSVKAGIIDSKILNAEEVKTYSKIPAKPVLVSQLLCVLTSPARSLAIAISEIAKSKAQ